MLGTRTYFGSNYGQVQVGSSYQWTIRSNVGDGKRDYTDPKAGECLKYGDAVYLPRTTIRTSVGYQVVAAEATLMLLLVILWVVHTSRLELLTTNGS